MTELNDTVITLDVDWAPDFAITKTADILIKNQTKATWFITHNSEAIQKLFAYPDLFEIGVHPNFMPGTTQGNDYHEIMNYVMSIGSVPNVVEKGIGISYPIGKPSNRKGGYTDEGRISQGTGIDYVRVGVIAGRACWPTAGIICS